MSKSWQQRSAWTDTRTMYINQQDSCCRNNTVFLQHACRWTSSSYPGGDAASWCIQRTHMVIHQHASLLLCSCYPLIPQTIKFTSTMQHCRLHAAPCLPSSLSLSLYLTETKLPLLSSLRPQALTILAAFSSLRLSSTLPVSLNLATCVDSPDALALLFLHATYALPLRCAFSNQHTRSQALLCASLPPTPPPGFISPQNISLLTLSLPLSLSSVSPALWLRPSSSGFAGRLTCVQGDGCAAASCEGGSFLRGGEARLGWGFVGRRRRRSFWGWQQSRGV